MSDQRKSLIHNAGFFVIATPDLVFLYLFQVDESAIRDRQEINIICGAFEGALTHCHGSHDDSHDDIDKRSFYGG